MSRTFINFIKKYDLSNALKELGLDYEGNVDDMRARLRRYLDVNDIPPDHELFIQNLRSLHDSANTAKELKVPTPRASRASSPLPLGKEARPDSIGISDVCDKVRKWGGEIRRR